MIRTALVIKSSIDYGYSLNRHVCIDLANEDELYSILKAKRDKIWPIIERILTNVNMYYDCYAKEKMDKKTKNISAIKIFDNDNVRIYCKELKTSEGEFFIICSKVIEKKVQKNNNKIKTIIQTIASHNYEIKRKSGGNKR